MNRFIHIFSIVVVIVVTMFVFSCNNGEEKTQETKNYSKVFDYVIDAGTLTKSNFSLENDKVFDLYNGNCSAIVKNINNQNYVIRNMDLSINNKPAYIIRTKIKDKNKTLGLSYNFLGGKDYKEVLKDNISEKELGEIAYLCTDVMNEHGLYIETNMRYGEPSSDPINKFGNTGTNPTATKKVYSIFLPQDICQNCKNITEAIEYLDTINIYSSTDRTTDINFCFIMADAEGNSGLLEIARNKIYWQSEQKCQTNFYVNSELKDIATIQSGLGRYEILTKNIDSVTDESQMYELINRVKYSKVYAIDAKDCEYERYSEYVGGIEGYTNEYVDSHKDDFDKIIQEQAQEYNNLTLQQRRDNGIFGVSIFTVIANCNKKQLDVRFFEDENKRKTFKIE